MKAIIITFIFIFISPNFAYSFEIDGLKSGMSLQEAKKVLERYSYSKIEIRKNNNIVAYDLPQTGNDRMISLTFCKGKLVQVDKNLKPRFDYFVKLVDEKRKELGKPIDAWSRPADITANVEFNAINFVWKTGDTLIEISYIEFATNNQLSLLYEIDNECWQKPW